jgi:hypothetical protein
MERAPCDVAEQGRVCVPSSFQIFLRRLRLGRFDVHLYVDRERETEIERERERAREGRRRDTKEDATCAG